MIFLFSLLVVINTVIPTGISPVTELPTEQSPLELLPASFSDISAPIAQPVDGNTVLVVVADYVSAPLSAELAQFQTDRSIRI